MDPYAKHPRLLALVGVILVVAALYFAKAVLVLFAIAFLLAFLLGPLVHRLQRVGLPRVASVVVVMLFAMSVAVGVGWLVVGQVNDLVNKLPEYTGNLREKFSAVSATIRSPLERASKTMAEITRPESGAVGRDEIPLVEVSQPVSTLDGILEPVALLVDVAAAIGIVILLGAVMLMKKEDLRDRLIRLAGRGHLFVTTRAFDEASDKVSRYLLLTTMINAMHGICIGTGLWLIGVPNALLWGLLSMLLRFIPYVGPWIAAAFPIALALAVFPGWTQPLLTVGLILLLELVSNNVIEPWVYGTRTGISPAALIMAAVFWTWIWGAPGLFLATPLTVCLAVMGKYVPPLRFLHVLFGDEPVLSSEAKLYQRLLAEDADEAWEVVAAELKSKTQLEVCDTVLIPALALAEQERHAGALDGDTFNSVARMMQSLIEEMDDFQHHEKADKAGGEAASAPAASGPTVPALCIAAEDAADGVVAAMAERALRKVGFTPTVVPSTALTGELPRIVEERKAQVVLVSNLPPSGFAQVRYICKRLVGKVDDLHVIIGVWGAKLDAEKARKRLPPAGTFYFASSLAEAMRQAHELHRSLSFKTEAGSKETPAPDVTNPDVASATKRRTHGQVHPPRASL